MADLFDDDVLSFDAELEPIITGTEPIPTCQIATQRFCSADLRPLAKPSDQMSCPCPSDFRQSIDLPLHLGTHQDFRHAPNPIPL